MGNSTTTAAVETTSNRRQPFRQTRMNPSRNVNGTRARDVPEEEPKPAHGFFPGITYFTDAITALPKEMIRQSTMLKEVDAKICGPEEHLKRLIATIPPMPTSQDDPADRTRREHFLATRFVMNEMLGSLDEKNHVISTANEALEKLLGRCDSAWPLIEQEISEETRCGRLDHWAYTDRTVEKKPTANTERSTRRGDAHATVAAIAADAEHSRSSKVQRRIVQVAAGNDSDFDSHKKSSSSNKRKPQDITSAPAGLGITHGAAQSNKRRKVEKPLPIAATGSHPMEKSLSSVFASGARNAGSPQLPTADTKKKGKAATGTNANGRRRAGTVTSTIDSPQLASSPIVGTFAPPGRGGNSPSLGTAMVRTSSTRARQNSSQQNSQTNRPQSAASTPQINGIAHTDHDRSGAVRPSSSAVKGEDNGESENRTSSRTNVKREEAATRPRPPSISTSTRNNGKASKTATPVVGSFAESSRPRSGRNSTTALTTTDLPPPKRSHKKKEPATPAAARPRSHQKGGNRPKDEDDSSAQDEEEDGEPLYCYCNGVSFGEMVACDMEGCKREWFHLECARLSKPPTAKTKWYCDDCKPKLQHKHSSEKVTT